MKSLAKCEMNAVLGFLSEYVHLEICDVVGQNTISDDVCIDGFVCLNMRNKQSAK